MQAGLEVRAFRNKIFGPDNKRTVIVINARRLPNEGVPLCTAVLIHVPIRLDR